MPRWLYALLIFSVLAPILNFLSVSPLITFVVASLGILPLAALIGQSIEQIAEHTGERIGGLLFATFGNATELIIGIFALLDMRVGKELLNRRRGNRRWHKRLGSRSMMKRRLMVSDRQTRNAESRKTTM